MTLTCRIDVCDKTAKSLGWCAMHYGRWKRNGDPQLTRRPSPGTYSGCSIKGCDRSHYGKGLCSRHYQRLWMHGDPTITLMEKFPGADWEDFVDKNGPLPVHNPDLGPCWIWKRSLLGGGYGGSHKGGRPQYVHRLAFARYVRLPDPNLTIDHLCRVRACCNPSHLEEVTLAENTRRGEAHQHKTCESCHPAQVAA
jgi:hypothetical protein